MRCRWFSGPSLRCAQVIPFALSFPSTPDYRPRQKSNFALATGSRSFGQGDVSSSIQAPVRKLKTDLNTASRQVETQILRRRSLAGSRQVLAAEQRRQATYRYHRENQF